MTHSGGRLAADDVGGYGFKGGDVGVGNAAAYGQGGLDDCSIGKFGKHFGHFGGGNRGPRTVFDECKASAHKLFKYKVMDQIIHRGI